MATSRLRSTSLLAAGIMLVGSVSAFGARPPAAVGTAQQAAAAADTKPAAPEYELTIETLYADGAVRTTPVAHTDESEAGDPVAGPGADFGIAAAQQCEDTAGSRAGHKVKGTFSWRYNPARHPKIRGSERKAIKVAATSLVNGKNDCGLPRKFATKHRYLGKTKKAVGCTTNGGSVLNKTNVVGWKKLTEGVLAVTCSWRVRGSKKLYAADIAINTRYKWFTKKVPAGCKNTFDLRSTMTHEWGHVFGLGHVSDRTHGTQTMATSIAPCTTYARTLGAGDHRMMRKLYGMR